MSELTQRFVLRNVIPAVYDLLPRSMNSLEATAMLLAIGRQEGDTFRARRQYTSGPARSFWQFEKAGVSGVLEHESTRVEIRVVTGVLGYEATTNACHAAIEHNDVLAACFARLLLWTLPEPLPEQGESEEGWAQYLRAWRPGKPHRETWAGHFDAAWRAVHEVKE